MKTRDQYLSEYEAVLSNTRQEQQKETRLQSQKAQLQGQVQHAQNHDQTNDLKLATINNQITAVNNQIKAANAILSSLHLQGLNYTNELNKLGANDIELQQDIASVEAKYQNIVQQMRKHKQASIDIKVLLNGFSAKEGLELKQTEVLAKLLPPEELVRTDILKNAIKLNHIDEFNKIIDQITEINFQDIEGKTLIMHAAANGFYHGVEKLLAMGADVNILDKNGANLLIHAAKVPHLDYIRKIAELVENVNCQDSDGNNGLHYAVLSTRVRVFWDEYIKYNEDLTCGGDTIYLDMHRCDGITVLNNNQKFSLGGEREDGHTLSQAKSKLIIKALLDCGLNLNTQNLLGQTPLYLACALKFKYLTNYFLTCKARTDLPDNQGVYLLHLAVGKGFTEIVKLLVPYCDINQKTASNVAATALYIACQIGNLDIVKWLLDHGANSNLVRADTGVTPLCVAMQMKQLVVVKELLTRDNIDLSLADSNGNTVLAYTMLLADKEVLQTLKNRGVDLNNQDNNSPTLFYLSCLQNNIQMMRILHELGANINILNPNGFHPIHGAIHNGHTNVIEELLKFGVSIDTRSTSGYTPLQYYCEQPGSCLEVVKFLLVKGASLSCMQGDKQAALLYLAVICNNLEIVDFLLGNGADVNVLTTEKISPLYCSMGYHGQPIKMEMVELLINKGADVTHAVYDGDTPMHMAGYRLRPDIMELLLSNGANINAKNHDGKTALNLVIEQEGYATSEQKILAVKYLLSHGGLIGKGAEKGAIVESLEMVQSFIGPDEVLVQQENIIQRLEQSKQALLPAEVQLVVGDHNLAPAQAEQDLIGELELEAN